MTKEYTVIEARLGSSVENAVNTLHAFEDDHKGLKHAKLNFNGTWLYSDTVDMDEAYITITGSTKEKREADHEDWLRKIEKEQKEYEDTLPLLEKMYIEKGHKILSEENWDYWDKTVPHRLKDLYRGKELSDTLEIAEILNNGGSFKEAKAELEEQRHSGMSWSLMKWMIFNFCDRGEKFVGMLDEKEAK